MTNTNPQRTGGDVRAIDWDDLVGQTDVKRRLDIRIKAALNSDRPLSHVLLTAAPGFGKTTLANMIAIRLGERTFKALVAPVAIITVKAIVEQHQDEPLVIFIDEFHRTSKADQEAWLTLLEEGFIESGGERIYHPNLTVIAGTTARDKVIPAMVDRFPIKPVFEDYTDDEMASIIEGMASRIGLTLPEGMAVELGRATGGTPRNGRGLVEAARDLSEIGEYTAADVIDLAGVTEDGLDGEQLKYLGLLYKADRQRLGLGGIAAQLQMHPHAVEGGTERLLLKRGYIDLHPAGRVLTKAGAARIEKFRQTGL